MQHLETCLREILSDRDYEVHQPEAGCRRHATQSRNDSAICRDENESQQYDPYPSQIQEDLNVTIVCLVQLHTDHDRHLVNPWPDPETLEARSEDGTLD